ncbi:hypothetical protein WDZ16_09530 [Pseudokineococcus marinus]|uniref:hypothetical protein n=1 Tax=Pseudokineococcus marinus TaxID=351215 RepID=UPI001BB11B13|nr:hypothetical protein [Pseudokineococcus marinus]
MSAPAAVLDRARRPGAGALARARALGGRSDVALGADLLRGVPTNDGRSEDLLRQVSERAQAFGRRMAAAPQGAGAPGRVVERDDGLDRPDPVVARYLHREGVVEVFTDAVALCEDLVELLGWRAWFPTGSVRAAAVAHERAHHLVAERHAAELRGAVGVPALRLGRWVRWAHVAGAEELAAHAFAQQALGLGRSPLLVTAAATTCLEAALAPPSRTDVVKEF